MHVNSAMIIIIRSLYLDFSGKTKSKTMLNHIMISSRGRCFDRLAD